MGEGGSEMEGRQGPEELKDAVDRHAEKSESPPERRGERCRDVSIHKVILCLLSVGVCSPINSRSLHVYVCLSVYMYTAYFILFFCFFL